jgi:ABC-type polysaccharide/polyol phosphate transport system ATPase subunit
MIELRPDQAILCQEISKDYKLYSSPTARLKEALHPLRKTFHSTFSALTDISFEVKRGETVGIVGRNGAGKSTLLKIISGVLTPSRGEIAVRGRISSLLELGTGFNPELTGIENIFFNGMLVGMTRADIQDRLQDIITFADIGEFINHPVKIYSSGMFARLAFAVAFHVSPDILIVDEALSVGDMLFQKKCYERFKEIRESGCTILFVSHDTYQVRGYCQRALYLKSGKMVAFGPADDVMSQYMEDQEAQSSTPQSTVANQKPLGNLSITDVKLLNSNGQEISEITSGDSVKIAFKYRATGAFKGKLSFVFNLYRHDDLYICGATSIMDRLPPIEAQPSGEVSVTFPSLPLLAGRYKWRVAINDESGLGIYTEALPVCQFQVKDSFNSVGLVHFQREWRF